MISVLLLTLLLLSNLFKSLPGPFNIKQPSLSKGFERERNSKKATTWLAMETQTSA